MSLLEATVRPVVNQLATGRQPAWTAADVDTITAKLVTVSGLVTPHIVKDVPLSASDTQQFLLSRTRAAIDAWLIRAAAEMRQASRLGPPIRSSEGRLSLGLRTATNAELRAAAGVSDSRAASLARILTLHPDIRAIDDLDAVEGIGPATLHRLKAAAYLDQPRAALVSATVLRFAVNPTIEGYLTLLDGSDYELFYGDANTMGRQPPQGGTPVRRFMRLLDVVQIDAQRRLNPLAGALASVARRQLARQTLRRRYRAALAASDGAIVVNDAYIQAMLDLIGGAANTVRLAMFVATASTYAATGRGSLTIIEALEAAVARGVAVRAIFDRDRPDDPYHSSRINRPVRERLRAAGAAVKQDETETLLHSKFLVADTSRVIVGSHNLTTSSIAHTHEVSVRLESAPVAGEFAARFDALWAALP